jgi:hypothetical protein
MTPTRDSLVWIFGLLLAIVGYLIGVGKPPTEWNYGDWLATISAALGILMAKLQGSPLQLSYKGQRQVAQGINPFYELPSTTSPGDTVPMPRPSDKDDTKL